MAVRRRIDFRKKYQHLYSPSARRAQEVVLPALKFVSIEGRGKPEGSQAFQDAISALYGITYTLKFNRKKQENDYTISPLEGLWWTKNNTFTTGKSGTWFWKLMIMQPDFITNEEFDQAVHELQIKKPNLALGRLRLETFDEGLCVQIMHIGPYEAEAPTIARLDEFAKHHELQMHGKHHEIYLGDPRRSRPERLRTVLRRPVYAVAALSRS